MIHSLWYRLWLFLLGVGLVAGYGCAGSSQSKFYTLSPVPPSGEVKTENKTAGPALAVGVGPVRLPQYLSGKEIVTRTDPYNIDLAEFDRWGGSLQDDFMRNLLENLSLYLGKGGTSLYSYPAMGAVDYRVGVDVIRFDGSRGGNVVLIANWTIRNGQSNKVVLAQNSRIQEPSGGQSYEALVGGMSRALGRLSREIGDDIKTLPR